MQINSAMKCAVRAHRGQLDKGGKSYIRHPARVAGMVKKLGEDFEVVAWLHDVIEDTNFFEIGDISEPDMARVDLEHYGLTTVQANALIAITKLDTETHKQYIDRVAKDFVASVVKIADLRDNLSPERLHVLSYDSQQYCSKKYTDTLRFLMEGRWT